MIVTAVVQIAFGAATLIAAFSAIHALLRRHRAACWRVLLTGAFSMAFFLTVPDIPWQVLSVPVLLMAAGIIMMKR